MNKEKSLFESCEIPSDLNFGFSINVYKKNKVIATMHHKPISKIIDFDAPKTSG